MGFIVRLSSQYDEVFDVEFESLADFYQQWDNHFVFMQSFGVYLPRNSGVFTDKDDKVHELEAILKYELISPLTPEDEELRTKVLEAYFGPNTEV